jgi:hypothetical protein
MLSDMFFPRHNHESVLLDTGEVLIIGGSNCLTGGCHSTLEFYDPATGSWQDSYIIVMGRKWIASTVLADGSVLITGGRSCGEPTSRTELYLQPSTDRGSGEDAFGPSEVAVILLMASIPFMALIGVAHRRK